MRGRSAGSYRRSPLLALAAIQVAAIAWAGVQSVPAPVHLRVRTAEPSSAPAQDAPGKEPAVHAARRPKPKAPAATEKAVLEGLHWLARHQNADGSWGAETYAERCSPAHACLPADAKPRSFYDEGLTALALLCFLGAEAKPEQVDEATGKEYRIDVVMESALAHLIGRQRADGAYSPAGFMYCEAMATMAVCEAVAFTGEEALREPARKGVEFLLAAQKVEPVAEGRQGSTPWGWRYSSRARDAVAGSKAEERYTKARKARAEAEALLAKAQADKEAGKLTDTDFALAAQAARAKMQAAHREQIEAATIIDQANSDLRDADISVTTWVIMALKSARMSGIDVPEEAMRGGLEYARWVSVKDGLVGYQDPAQAGMTVSGPKSESYSYHIATMSSLGMLVRTFVEHNLQDSFLEQAAKKIVLDLPVVSKDNASIDYYYWHVATLALHQLDGPESPKRSGKLWKPWEAAMVETLLSLQDKSRKRGTCTRGGWLATDRWGHGGGYALYATAMSILTLQVYYRCENAFASARRK